MLRISGHLTEACHAMALTPPLPAPLMHPKAFTLDTRTGNAPPWPSAVAVHPYKRKGGGFAGVTVARQGGGGEG